MCKFYEKEVMVSVTASCSSLINVADNNKYNNILYFFNKFKQS